MESGQNIFRWRGIEYSCTDTGDSVYLVVWEPTNRGVPLRLPDGTPAELTIPAEVFAEHASWFLGRRDSLAQPPGE